MRKPFVVIIGIFLLSQQLHCCLAFDLIGTASSVIGLGQFVYSIVETFISKDVPINTIERSMIELRQQIWNDMTIVINMLKDMPDMLRYELQISELEKHFVMVQNRFLEAVEEKKKVDVDHQIELNNTQYMRLADGLIQLQDAMNTIRYIISEGSSAFVLRSHFTSNVLRFEDVCKTGASPVQLLDALLGSLKVATAQYYLAKKYILEIEQLAGKDNSNLLETHRTSVNAKYANAVADFKKVMANASLELHACDSPNGYNDSIRHTNETDPTYAELQIHTKYIFGEEATIENGAVYCMTATKCHAVTKLEKYNSQETKLRSVRTCPGKLIGCQQLTNPSKDYRICKNKDKNSYNRYYSVTNRGNPGPDYYCDDGSETYISTQMIHDQFVNYPEATCNYCHCLCEEGTYYIEIDEQVADDNKIVTGAQILMENNTLRIQIEQARLLANGTIDRSTLEWIRPRSIEKSHRVRISEENFKKFALTPVVRPDDEVITGLSFEPVMPAKIVYLSVKSRKFDFRAGILKPLNESELIKTRGSIPTEKYDISEQDAPTKAIAHTRLPNKPILTNNHYVELTLTSLVKDGGQTVVPFIDTQKVSAHGPLSGASLYLKGQPGYAGFLGIKLYTFDIRNYIDASGVDNVEL